MKKVIAKCKLSSRERFEEKLAEIDLDFSPVYWQHDRVYAPRGYKRGMNLPRLVMRTEMHAVDKPAKHYLILRRHIESSGVDVVEQTLVTDYEETVKIILQLGFKSIAEVSRRRQDLKMGEGTYIYLDKIENQAGYFAKIESELGEDDSVEEAKADLEKTFKTLGESHLMETAYEEL